MSDRGSNLQGRLEVIRGCMFSGKTERLIARLRDAQQLGLRVVAIKHRIDDRYDATHLVTHRHDRFDALRATDAAEIEHLAADHDVIGIDEGHFFGAPLLPVVKRLIQQGKRVIVAGIDNDAWGKPFRPMPELISLADEDVLATTACVRCGKDARFSQRMVPVHSAYMVGGAGDYEPRCGDCFEPLPGSPPEQA